MKECEHCSKHAKGFKRANIDKLLSGSAYRGSNELRWKRTNGIIEEILNQYKDPKIIDLAVGGGEDALFLAKKGYNITANDVDEYLLSVTEKKAKENGFFLKIIKEDWINILNSKEYSDNEFDFAYILGNSFPNYLFREKDRITSLKGFWRILKPKGILFFDTRNFDYILDNKEFILMNPENNFRYDGTNTYLKNNDYRCFPALIEDQLIHWCVKKYPTKQYGCLNLWPATEERIKKDIKNVFGNMNIEIYYDYKKIRPKHYDFIQYKLTKSYSSYS
ncbi:MAG: class I SAM-dependent methyltransferase [Atribacterota bacterium]|nr:class I SAM-dependent methyltransferase [Atribacterota bacterium]